MCYFVLKVVQKFSLIIMQMLFYKEVKFFRFEFEPIEGLIAHMSLEFL